MRQTVLPTPIQSSKISGLPFLLFKSSIFLITLRSLNAWFLWDFLSWKTSLFCLLLAVPFLLTRPQAFKFEIWTVLQAFAFAGFIGLTLRFTNSNGAVVISIYYLAALLPLFLTDGPKQQVLDFVLKAYAVLLAPSIVVWLILMLGLPFPSLGTISNPAWEAYVYQNHFFVLHNTDIYDKRFCAVFLEPGHLGLIGAFLLAAIRFDMRSKSAKILAFATFLTFSLAGYVLVVLGLLLHLAANTRRPAVLLGGAIALTAGFWVFFSNYNGGDNLVNEMIFSRLEIQNGDIAGNNRFTEDVDVFYYNFLSSPEAWLGIGAAKYQLLDLPSAGYKVFLIQYGILGTVLIFLLYMFGAIGKRSLYAYSLLFLYSLSFLQRGYPHYHFEIVFFLLSLYSSPPSEPDHAV